MKSSAPERTTPSCHASPAQEPRTEIQKAPTDLTSLPALPNAPPPAVEPAEMPDYESLVRQDWDARAWESFLTWEGLRPLFNLFLVVASCLMALPLFASGLDVVDPLTKVLAVALLANFAYTLVPLASLGLTWLETPPRAVKICTSVLGLLLCLGCALLATAVLFHPRP